MCFSLDSNLFLQHNELIWALKSPSDLLCPSHHFVCSSRNDASFSGDHTANRVPADCWENILGHLSPAELAQAACINKACKTASGDQRLWSPHVKREWSAECCVRPLRMPIHKMVGAGGLRVLYWLLCACQTLSVRGSLECCESLYAHANTHSVKGSSECCNSLMRMPLYHSVGGR